MQRRRDFSLFSLFGLSLFLGCFSNQLRVPAPIQDANKNFPKIGLYCNTHGNGNPLVNDDLTLNDALIRDVSRFSLITLNTTPFADYQYEVLSRLRTYNPKIRI